MSQESYFGLAYRELMRTNPEVLTIDEEKLSNQIAETSKAAQALHAKNDKAKAANSDTRKEYNQLRKDLFTAQEWAKNAEIYCNDQANNVKHFEGRITELPLRRRPQLTTRCKSGSLSTKLTSWRLRFTILKLSSTAPSTKAPTLRLPSGTSPIMLASWS